MAFGFSLPKLPTQALAGDPSGGLSMSDKLMMFGAIAKGHPDLAMQIPLMAAARRQFQAQQAATSDMAQFASGRPIPSRAELAAQIDPTHAADYTSPPTGPQPGDTLPNGVTIPAVNIPQREPAADAMGGPVTVRSALPLLSRMARTGVNIEPWTKLLEAAQPKSVVVNGRVLDERDPSIYGGYYGEAPTKGAEPVYDSQGRQVGWHMADGAIQSIQAGAQAQAAGTKAGELPFAGPTAEATAAGTELGKAPYTLITKDVNGVPTTMTTTQALTLAGAAPGGAAGAAPAATAATGAYRLDPQAFYKQFVLKHEGGLNPSDLNGAPTMYGFNQTANPDIDVKSLTPDTAAQRFADKYFAQSGAANLPAPLAAAHADTYFINPKKAQQILQQSGGDPGKYMDLREQWLKGLVQTQPGAAKYAQAWANRNADLRNVVQQLGGEQGSPTASAMAPTAAAAPGFHGLSADDQKAVQAARDDAKAAEDLAGLGHQFQALNKKTATGWGYAPLNVPIPFTHSHINLNLPGMFFKNNDVPAIPGIGLAPPGSSNIPAMENLGMRMAIQMRAPGERLTQDLIKKNVELVPGYTKMPSRNDTIVGTFDQRAATKRAYANFMSDWISQHGSLTGADQAWAQQQAEAQGAASQSPASAPKPPPMRGQPMQQIRLKSGGVATVVPVG